jgi:P4 family phage/plasmid primase-like protien
MTDMRFSFFDSVKATEANIRMLDHDNLVAILSNPIEAGDKAGVPLFTPEVYTGSRGSANIEYYTGAILDIDSGVPLLTIIGKLNESGVKSYHHTTYNHSVAHPKFHIVIPFSSAVYQPDHYLGIWDYFNKLLGGCLDANARRKANLSYLPSKPIGGMIYEWGCNAKGVLFDPKSIPVAGVDTKVSVFDSLGASTLSEIWVEGNRNAAALAVSGALRSLGVPEHEALLWINNFAASQGDDSNRSDEVTHTYGRIGYVTGIPEYVRLVGEDGIGALRREVNGLENLLRLVDDAGHDVRNILDRSAELDVIDREELTRAVKKSRGLSKAGQVEYLADQSDSASNDAVLELVGAFIHQFSGGDGLVNISGGYWYYNGRNWVMWSKDRMMGEALAFMESSLSFADCDDVATPFRKMKELLVPRLAVKSNLLDLTKARPPVINCTNGELWYEGGGVNLRPHNHKSEILNAPVIEWNADAECPRFMAALRTVFDAEGFDADRMVNHVLEIIGYMVQPQRPLAAWFLFIGEGQDGKSLLMELVGMLVGSDSVANASIVDIQRAGQKGFGQLVGKMLMVDDDLQSRTTLPDGMLKKISESKVLTGAFHHVNPFQFRCGVVPVMLSNGFPAVRDLSKGMRRRANLVPFPVSFEDNANSDIYKDLFKEEMAGILRVCVDAGRRVLDRCGFDTPPECIALRDDWLAESHPIAMYMDECVESFKGDGRLYVNDIYTDFRDWCMEAGIKWDTDRRRFTTELKKLRYRVEVGGAGKRFIDGYRIKREAGDF